MERQWLRKIGDIREFVGTSASSNPSPVSFNRQWQDLDDEDTCNLNDCIVGVSPTGHLVVLIRRSKCLVLTNSSPGSNVIFHLRTTIDLSGAPDTSKDTPTCVICLPVASQKVSTNGQAEWICIAVGFRSGLIQMYTENGIYLFGQTFSPRPIVQLKCRTQHWLNHQSGNVAEPGDDFSILFSDGILVTIDGFGLFQLLRVVYAQQALRSSTGATSSSSLPPNMLNFTKWKFVDADNVNDFITCGIRSTTELNTLFYSTIHSGEDVLSCNNLSHFVSTGSVPFVCSWTGQERKQSGSLIQDVTTAVTNKIMSGVAGFLSWSRQTDQQKYSSSSADDQNQNQDTPKFLNIKHIIHDRPRIGQKIAASPNHRLAAITDNFNRVYVLDLESCVIIKQFKGYREAQVGWVRSLQDADFGSDQTRYSEKRNSRATQFLVIHSPRRCLIEVWGGERWERIHSADVPPNSCLIYTPHGMLGWTRSLMHDPADSGLGSCFLLSADGAVSTVEVAFHWAVADRNRAKLLDQALRREFENALKEENAEAFSEILAKMQLDETRDSCVQMLIRHYHQAPTQLVDILNGLLHISKRLPADEGQRFHDLCSKAVAVINLHVNLDLFVKSVTTPSLGKSHGVNLDAILSTFCLRGSVRESYSQIFETYCLVNGMKIQDEQRQQSPVKPMPLLEFLELLSVLSRPGISKESSDVLLGGHIFGSLFQMEDVSDRCHQFESAIALFACQLFKPIDLLRFLLAYYFSPISACLTVDHMSILISILQALSRLPNNDRNAFWDLCYKMSLQSFVHVKALTVALIAGQLSSKTQPIASEEQSSLLEMAGDWESDAAMSAMLSEFTGDIDTFGLVTDDKWNNLCSQLTVLSLFEMLVSCKPVQSQQPADTGTDGWDTEVQDAGGVSMVQLSSAMIADSGVDLLCEHICRWIVASKFDVASFYGRNDLSALAAQQDKLLTVESTIDHLLARLITMLPASLSRDQILAGCSWEAAHCWSRQEVVGSQPYLLEACIQYANLITSANIRLKCWLLEHIWAKLIRPVFQNIFLSTLRLDRPPKDVEIGDGLSELSMEQVAVFTCQLFEKLIEHSQGFDANSSTETPTQNLLVEALWPNPSADKGRISLAEQAATADVQLSNKGCLYLHLQAALVMKVIIHFRMKPAGLDHLFSHIEQSILFQDLFSAPTPPPHVLDYVTESRTSFIIRITKSVVIAVKPQSLSYLLTNCGYYDDWNKVAIQLVDIWHLDRSAICGKELAMFCCLGISEDLFKLAEKLSSPDKEDLNAVRFWQPIISAIGHQIARCVFQSERSSRSQGLRNRLDAFAPELGQWLTGCLSDQESISFLTALGDDRISRSFESRAKAARTLQTTSRLLSLSLSQLPESYSFYSMTLALCELIGTLQEESSL